MQDPANPNPEFQPFSFQGSGHRRAHSEVHFRIPEDLDLGPDPFEGPSGNSFHEDDLFCSYMDIEKLGSRSEEGQEGLKLDDNAGDGSGGGGNEEAGREKNARPRHRYSNSVDGSSMLESIEAKKAMAPDKLAELWTLDPKRAKRIIANRQSAARSKERKARYMSELERKVQTLQTEATTLSAQLTLFQRDTTDLSTENTELKIRLQAMEQQAQLRDALNEALKKEVERLKVATGEIMTPTESYNLGMQHIPYNQCSFFPPQALLRPVETPNIQIPQFHHFHSNISMSQQQPMVTATPSHALSELLPQDSLRRLQGLEISNRSSFLVKSEGPSLSASESSSI